jgi:glutaconate CoA-transferase, subunit B
MLDFSVPHSWIDLGISKIPLLVLIRSRGCGCGGAGGAPEISSSAKEVLIVVKHSKRTLVNRLDFVTSVGFGMGGDAREKLDLAGKGPVAVITDLCILRPDTISRELEVASIHPGVDRKTVADSTGGQTRFADGCDVTEVPGTGELEVLRDLKAPTAAADGVQGDEA